MSDRGRAPRAARTRRTRGCARRRARRRARGLARRAAAAVTAAALVVSAALAALAPVARTALAAAGGTTITFGNGGTATLGADGTVTGTCRLENGWDDPTTGYEAYVNLPDGSRLLAICYENHLGLSDHGKYAAPCAGTYDFTATPLASGSGYEVLIKSNVAPHAAPGHAFVPGYPAQHMLVTRWSPTTRGSVRIAKASAQPGVTASNPLYDLSGACFGVYSDESCSPGSLVATMETDASGSASADGLLAGDYYVREISAPRGYLLDETVRFVSVRAGREAALTLTDAPRHDTLGLVVQKVDAQADAEVGWAAQGDATLEGAEFTVRFYEGSYDDVSELPETASRTWVIRTVAADGRVRARLSDDCKVSGDAWYATDSEGRALLPLGTLAVQETRAPRGYVVSDGSVHLAQVVEDDSSVTGASVRKLGSWTETFDHEDAGAGLAIADEVLRGGVSVEKIDHDLADGVAQGDATLAGAQVSVTNASAGDVVVGGRRFSPGDEVTTITTDESGRASTAADALPFGTYALREKTPPEGYLLNEDWSVTVSVQQAGIVAAAPSRLPENVARGGGSVAKADADLAAATAQGDATLEGAEISIYNRSDAAVCVNDVVYQSGDVVARLRLDESGAASTGVVLPYGTYEARETAAPTGYLLNEAWSQTFEVREDGQTVELAGLADEVVRGGVTVRKTDAELGESRPQGDAALAGAAFTVYNRSAAPVVVGGHTCAVGEAVATITTDEGGRASTGERDLPFGTYELRETAAPEGYLPDEEWTRTIEVRADGAVTDLTAPEHAVTEDVIRGGVAVRKTDRELVGQDGHGGAESASVPLGAATLAGAVLEVTNDSTHEVLVDGITYQGGEVVLTLVTDEAGAASTAPDALPYGTYTVREVAAPEGYLVSDGWSETVEVREDGRVYELTSDADAVADQVVRGDLSLQKSSAGGERMAGVPFRVTSLTTGEWHLVVTDENGMLDTSANWNSHGERTNASDAALLADGTIDEGALDAGAGVWFSGRSDATTAPDDALGALPYDTYAIDELRCSANEGHNLVGTIVRVSRDGVNLDVGTFDDEPTEQPALATRLRHADTDSQSVPAAEGVRLVDAVSLEGLTRGTGYQLLSELHAFDAEGRDQGVVAQAQTEFTPTLSHDEVEVELTVDTSELAGMRLVAYESLCEGATVVLRHADPGDSDQTVYVPAIRTTLTSDATSNHDVPSRAGSGLTDTVTLTNLVAGETYRVSGELHLRDADGGDAGPLTGPDGEPVGASVTFTAEAAEQEVTVPFEVDASALGGRELVAFETLARQDVALVSHADINDADQTVRVVEAEPEPSAPVPQTGGAAPPSAPVPQTGEAASLVAPVALAGAAAVGGSLAWRRRRKR
ncbi:SpaA isopeptide-forming pilin-related protein [Thermophilibacter sp.]